MRLLALETSTEYCSVALWQDGNLSSRCELAGQRHSELLIAMLDEVLREAGMKLAQLDGIAFGMGPGSFTGVRIACGVAQGLALGADLPVVGVCTLQALAQASGHDKVIAALDARMSEIYHAAYEKQDEEWTVVCAPNLCLPQQAGQLEGAGWFGAGSGFAAHGAALQQRYAGQLIGSDAHAIPNAAAIAQLAAPQFAAGRGVDAAQAMPLYLRDKVALKTNERVGARHSLTVRMRPMAQADVDAVLGIEQAVQAYPWTRGNFMDALNSGYMCCVDEADGEIRAYAVLMPVLEEAELLTIGVAAGQQRKGLGRAMLRELLEAARKKKMRRVFLEVRPSNAAAIALYRSAGFAEIGVRRGYYRNANGSEDAITMARELTGDTNG